MEAEGSESLKHLLASWPKDTVNATFTSITFPKGRQIADYANSLLVHGTIFAKK